MAGTVVAAFALVDVKWWPRGALWWLNGDDLWVGVSCKAADIEE